MDPNEASELVAELSERLTRTLTAASRQPRTRRGVVLAVVLLGGAITCARQAPPASTPRLETLHGIRTPLDGGRGGQPALQAQPALRAEIGSGTFTLFDFRPLLAEPGLERAALAVEEQKPEAALIAVDAWLGAQDLGPDATRRWQFLRGRLLEQAGDLARAIEAFDAAGAGDWPLKGYALFQGARLAIRKGEHALGLQRLAALPELPALGSKPRLLAAEAAYARGDRRRALSEWRDYLAALQAPERAPPDGWTGIALAFSEATLEEMDAPGSSIADSELLEAVGWAERVALIVPKEAAERARADALLARATLRLAPEVRKERKAPSLEAELFALAELVRAREFPRAEELATKLASRMAPSQRHGELGCQAGLYRAKATAGLGRFGGAADALGDLARHCRHDPEQRAHILYLAGKYSASDKRFPAAISHYEALEKELPGHRFSDDARLRRARAYLELGSEARFGELLRSLPDDYPEGDSVLDGVFELAMHRIEARDWSGAATGLERAARWIADRDPARGTEFSGRERYFWARALMETGETARGLEELERIVRELPLSYYMLHAHARLRHADPARAEDALRSAVERALSAPFAFARRAELESNGFQRVVELFRVGEVELARQELDALGYAEANTAPDLLWAIALLYEKAGSAKLSHGIARGLLTDWLSRWPAGDWATAWRIAFPRPYERLVRRFAKQSGVDESLAYAVMREESGFDPHAVSPASAYGLMQLIEPTAEAAAKPLGLPHGDRALRIPSVNIALGCHVLGELNERFAKNPELAIPAYNAGPGRPRRWLRERPNVDFDVWVELIPILETRRYTKRVLASRAAYRVLYEKWSIAAAVELPLKLES